MTVVLERFLPGEVRLNSLSKAPSFPGPLL
jgi:hypothetical protein